MRRATLTLAVFAAGLIAAVAASGAPLPFSFTATEAKTYSGPVAAFERTCTNDCSATVTWGDGSPPSAGTISPNNGATQTVSGSHLYPQKGQYAATVVINGSCGGRSCPETSTNTATVVDAPLQVSGDEIETYAGQSKEHTVGSFEDPGPTRPASVYKATVEWGDGTTSAASVVDNAGSGFDVRATHTYASEGTKTYIVRVDEDGDNDRIGSATGTAKVAGPNAPVPTFSYGPDKPVAGLDVAFAASATLSGASGPATFAWKLCPPIGPCVDATGDKTTQKLSLAPVKENDPQKPHFKPGPGARRRTTYLVTVTATDKFGRSGSATRSITVVPNTPPRATFDIVRKGLGKFGLKTSLGYPVLDDVDLRPTASDPDPGDGIAEMLWDLSGDNRDDLSCKPLQVCTILEDAFGEPLPPPTNKDGKKNPGVDTALKSPPIATLLDIGAPVVNPDPGANVIELPNGEVVQKVNGRAAQARPRAELGPKLATVIPPAFDALRFNFGRMVLARYGVPQGKLLAELPPPATKGPYPTIEENVAAGLRMYHEAAAPLASAQSHKFPNKIRLTVKDRTGAASVAEQPIAFRSARYPKGSIAFKRDLDKGPVTTTESFGISFQGVKDPEKKPLYLVLEIGVLGKYRCTNVSTYEELLKVKWKPSQFCSGVGIAAKAKAGSPAIVKTLIAPTLDNLKAQLAFQKAAGNLKFSALGGAGIYAASLSVYDAQGLGTHAFVSGVKVVEAGDKCQKRETYLGDGDQTFLKGDCITLTEATEKTNAIYKSTKAISLNDLALQPSKGATINIVDGEKPLIYATPAGADVYVLADDTPIGVFQPGVFSGRVLFDPDGVKVDVVDKAVLRGLPVAPGTLTARLGDKSSTLNLELRMPSVFTDPDQPGKPSTSAIQIDGEPPPEPTVLERFEILGPWGQKTASTAARRRARAAVSSFSIGPISTTVAGMQVNNLNLSYDEPTDTWEGSAQVIIDALPVEEVTGNFIIRGDQLIFLGGFIQASSPGIQIAPGVFAESFTFEVNLGEDPNVYAGMHFTAAKILTGDGSVRIHPKPFRIRFDGSIGIGPIPLASAYLYVDASSGMAFGGKVGYDFGPASFHASVNGWVNLNGDFAVIGQGEACLFACLDISALASSIGVAGCGEVDLFLTSISAGFGYRYGGGLSVWVNSCDLNSYVPAGNPLGRAAQNKPGAAPARPVGADAPTFGAIAPGETRTFDVKAGEQSLAVQALAAGAGEVAPRLTLTGPGNAPRVVTMPALSGDYTFGGAGQTKVGSTLVDSNPLDRTTSMIVALPEAGKWTLRVNDDSVPVASVRLGHSMLPITQKTTEAKVVSKVGGKRVSDLASASKKAKKAAVAKNVDFEPKVKSLPRFAKQRLRAVSYEVGKLEGKVTFISRGAQSGKVLGTAKPGEEGSIVFDPPSSGGKQDLLAFYTRPDGMPRVVRKLATYTPPGMATPSRPSVKGFTRKGDRLTVKTATGPAAGVGANDIVFRVNVEGADGSFRTVPIRAKDVKKRKGGWQFVVSDAPLKPALKVSVRQNWMGETGPPTVKSVKRVGPALRKLP